MFDLILFYNNILEGIVKALPNIFFSIFIFLIFLTIAHIANNYIQSNINKFKSNNIVLSEFAVLLYYFIIIIGLIIAFINLGIEVATIITLLGTVGLAIALSIKGCVEDIIAGIYISSNDLFNIGDRVEIGDVHGYVHEINLFYTTINELRTTIPVIVNNSKVKASNIVNWTKYEFINCQNIFLISNFPLNNTNYTKIFNIIREATIKCQYITDKSKIRIDVLSVNNNYGTQIMVLSPIRSVDFVLAYLEINNLVREALFNNNIFLS